MSAAERDYHTALARLQNFTAPLSDQPVDWALAYAAVGMAVFPVANKRPLTEHGFKDATTDPETIEAWWARYPHADIGWAVPVEIVVADLDVGKGVNGFKVFAAQEGMSPDAIETPQASTPRGGRHLIYSANGCMYKNGARDGVDLRTIGGYVALPRPGNGRAWLKPLSIPLAPVPHWVKPVGPGRDIPARAPTGPVSPFAKYTIDHSVCAIARRVALAQEGERNSILFWAACRFAEYASAGVVDAAWAADLLAFAATRAGLSDREARLTIKSGFGRE
jgi:hypothetical protein